MNKTLVVYFSASGETKAVALALAEGLQADVEEITPVPLYSSADLNWRDRNSRTTLEMQDESSRPKIQKTKYDVKNYETILIGFPIWWGVEPRVVDTYIDENDLRGKKIIVFATSGGSPLSLSHLKKTYPQLNFISSHLCNFGVDLDSFKKEI